MTPGVPGGAGVGGDILTRTTLQVNEDLSLPSGAQLIKALQHVPGVLLAEIAGNARAIVAHDAAVPGASLLAAAERAGMHATIVADTRVREAGAVPAGPPAETRPRRLLTLAAAILFGLAVGNATVRLLPSNHILMPILLSSAWAIVIAYTVFKRRK